ncbi:MAG: pyridoxal-phosphate dependent enzyme [Chitinophagaceae bacterium]|nr:pyridoxal-phosphate dependent enzyme [Chitinophagaceae bacterium]
MLRDISAIRTDQLTDDLFVQLDIRVSVLRADLVHPVVSGNKLFKLRYFLEEAVRTSASTLLTFGGAYSNHLVATAFAGQASGFQTIGIVRGKKPASPSLTLQQCESYGMRLHYVSREEYAGKQEPAFIQTIQDAYGPFLLIPEGGYHPRGASGASGIMNGSRQKGYTHICTACGTATTLAGLLAEAEPGQRIIGIPVLKGMNDWEERIQYLLGGPVSLDSLEIWDDHHFGGYAKKNESLIRFMNECWEKYGLPLDFVYTAKMMHAVMEKIKAGYFTAGSHILCIHTGGLQGNRSLPVETLLY